MILYSQKSPNCGHFQSNLVQEYITTLSCKNRPSLKKTLSSAQKLNTLNWILIIKKNNKQFQLESHSKSSNKTSSLSSSSMFSRVRVSSSANASSSINLRSDSTCKNSKKGSSQFQILLFRWVQNPNYAFLDKLYEIRFKAFTLYKMRTSDKSSLNSNDIYF